MGLYVDEEYDVSTEHREQEEVPTGREIGLSVCLFFSDVQVMNSPVSPKQVGSLIPVLATGIGPHQALALKRI